MSIFIEVDENQDSLALQVKDLDAAGGRRAKPVPVRAEHERVDDIARLERVQVLSVIEVPEHCDAILAAGSSQGAVRRDRDRVNVSSVSVVVCAQLALGKLPDLPEHNLLVARR